MPASSKAPDKKRKQLAFSPPRPNKKAGATTSKGSSRQINTSNRKNSNAASKATARNIPATLSESDSTDVSDEDSVSHMPSNHSESEPDYILAEVTHADEVVEDSSVPLPLLHTLLNHHFSDKDKMRVSHDAREVVGKYIDTFVREAIARSALEQQEKADTESVDEFTIRKNDGWLEVEDLEKMAPQLVLDF